MNKKEQVEFDKLQRELALAKALRFTDAQPVPLNVYETVSAVQGDLGARVATGWTFNSHTRTVSEGCFTTVSHNPNSPMKTTTQGPGGPWYQTERQALQALRRAVELRAAKELAEIDERIRSS